MDTPVAFERSLDGVLGVVYDTMTPEEVTGHVDVEPRLLAPHGAAPLGLFTAAAEGAASTGTAVGVIPGGNYASGMSNETTLTGSVRSGRVTFVARRRAQSADLWVWEVECFDASGATCAFSKVAIAVRPMRAPS